MDAMTYSTVSLIARSLAKVKKLKVDDGATVAVGALIVELEYIDLKRQAESLRKSIAIDDKDISDLEEQIIEEGALHDSAVIMADAYAKYLKAVHDLYDEGKKPGGGESGRIDRLQIAAEDAEAKHRQLEKITMRKAFQRDSPITKTKAELNVADKRSLLEVLKAQIANDTVRAPSAGRVRLACVEGDIVPFAHPVAYIERPGDAAD
jgi:multidrug resistance efflux pump